MTENMNLPHHIETEMSVLGALFNDEEAQIYASGNLTAGDFYDQKHKKIYASALDLISKGISIDHLTIINKLNAEGILDQCGHEEYIRSIATLPFTSNFEDHVRIIKNHARSRKLIEIGGLAAKYGYEGDEDGLDKLESEIISMYNIVGAKKDFARLEDSVHEYFRSVQNTENSGRVKTGFRDLDSLILGFQPSDLIILAARTSVGKSSAALNIAMNVGMQLGTGVAIFTLEMSELQVAQRFITMASGVSSDKILSMKLTPYEVSQLKRSLDIYKSAPIFTCDNPTMTVAEIRSKAKRLFLQQPNIGLIIVDYVQLIEGSRRTTEQERVSEISRSLKGLARDLNVPIIAISSLNREVDHRSPPIPVVSDLRSSGNLEYDSDIVLLLYREDKYDENTDRKGIADIYVAKNRNGRTGIVSLGFNENTTRYFNLERHDSVGKEI